MAKSPAFQFYVNDFLTGTLDFSAEQIGGYILLLIYQWDQGNIPDDDKKLLKIARIKSKSLADVKKKFKKLRNGYLINERLEAERKKQAEWKEKSAIAGIKSGETRRLNAKKKGTNLEPTLNQPSDLVGTNDEPNANSSSSSSISPSLEEDAGAKISDGLPEIIKRPDYAPPDEQVMEFFYQQGQIQLAEPFIKKHNENGWTDSDGKPIGKWRVWALGWIGRTIASAEREAKQAEKEAKRQKGKVSNWVPTERDNY